MPENLSPDELSRLRRTLDDSSDERGVVAYLRTNPWILYWTMCGMGGHTRYLFWEFPLSSLYQADAVILNSYSGVWEAIFIEFEPVSDAIFTKARKPSQRLAGAFVQLQDWRTYIEQNPRQTREDLVRWAGKRDQLHYSSGKDPSNYSGDRLADPQTYLRFRYFVFIGRSSKETIEQRSHRGRHGDMSFSDIITYDRILRAAERRYQPPESNTEGQPQGTV